MRLRINAFIFVFAILCVEPATAQDANTLEQALDTVLRRNDHNRVINLVHENDLLGGGTDQNYTSGVRATYFDMDIKKPFYADEIAELIPFFDITPSTGVFYSLGQNIYTPGDTGSRIADPADRPWAAFLYGSVGMVTVTDNHADEIEATLGVVGPAALGEQTQKFIHRHISGSSIPKGWSNQLENEPGLMLAWQRSWPYFAKGDIGPVYWRVHPSVGATVGNVHTYAQTGVSVQIGPGSNPWQDMPVRVRPSMPGTGYFEEPAGGWGWYIFAGAEGRAVARNIFLDGNTFRSSPSVDKHVFVGDLNAGVAFTIDRYRIAYTQVYRTREFDNQSDPEVFGAFSIGLRF